MIPMRMVKTVQMMDLLRENSRGRILPSRRAFLTGVGALHS